MPKPTPTVKITVWYCHNCSSGPLNCKIDAYCPYCHHQKCSGYENPLLMAVVTL
ncbi:hypothetical protein JMJ77_0014516 [Colletotrichum scovillei]|uniref:Uncharacterized protein n=1 Tax=Colletotrichum scovillei TaxID=1209932 RepID=A0A9P7R3N4_9PEZI|nr:hypothetical protein JMJ77_0014516 [Colletotrichum scovillei]